MGGVGVAAFDEQSGVAATPCRVPFPISAKIVIPDATRSRGYIRTDFPEPTTYCLGLMLTLRVGSEFSDWGAPRSLGTELPGSDIQGRATVGSRGRVA